ncbi:MAG: 2-amino-4-hydroxy-6-hydroxymethyldihydropteridine diphosphokinase [Myxococcota bacterium]
MATPTSSISAGSSGTPGTAIDVVVGLGSNLGDRRATLHAAVRAIEGCATLRKLSFLYETAPLGPAQPDYLNAAVALTTELSPSELLARLLDIERSLGRERRVRWGPRTIDLDILWIRGRRISLPQLVVPHPELQHRPFALLPLLDVAPDAVDPVTGVAYSTVLAGLDASGVRRAAPEIFDFG